MTVKELKEILERIEDDSLPVYIGCKSSDVYEPTGFISDGISHWTFPKPTHCKAFVLEARKLGIGINRWTKSYLFGQGQEPESGWSISSAEW